MAVEFGASLHQEKQSVIVVSTKTRTESNAGAPAVASSVVVPVVPSVVVVVVAVAPMMVQGTPEGTRLPHHQDGGRPSTRAAPISIAHG